MWEVNLDFYKLDKSIKDLDKFFNSYEKAINDAIDEIVVKTEKRLYINANAYGISPERCPLIVSRLENGVQFSIEGQTAMYLEFGTGIVGKSNPHPNPMIGWVYDINSHGEKGWWYPTVSSDPNPIKWTDKSGQLRAWTKGRPASPFVFDTFMYTRRIFTRTINKHIKRVTTK